MSDTADENGRFHLGDILSITTGYLVAPSGVGGVYGILNYMTGDSLFTHQLPRAGRECKPWLERQFPALSEAALASDIGALLGAMDHATCAAEREDAVRAWLRKLTHLHGDYHQVQPIPKEEHERRDAVDELVEMVGPERVIVINAPEAP